jgi:hypothetical protein
MLNRSIGVVLVAVLILVGVIFLAPGIRANPELCTASSLPEMVGANSDVNFQFSFTNTDPSTTIDWITITTPTGTFNIVSTSADGWNSYVDGSGAEFTDGALVPGATLTLNVEAQTGPLYPVRLIGVSMLMAIAAQLARVRASARTIPQRTWSTTLPIFLMLRRATLLLVQS